MPRVTEITVSAGRVVPHPHEHYANLRPMLSFKATVEDNEDLANATRILQGFAEEMLTEHLARLEARIEAETQAKLRRQEEEYQRRNAERRLAAEKEAERLEDLRRRGLQPESLASDDESGFDPEEEEEEDDEIGF